MAVEPNISLCPSCAKTITFSHPETSVVACSCGAVLNRKEDGLILEKPFYLVQNPANLIQPGTAGEWKGKGFKVLGRFRAWVEEFVFNYWTVQFMDGTLGYLGEGYGIYAVYEKIKLDIFISSEDLDRLKVGSIKELISRRSFLLERKYTCYKWEVEGEILLPECGSTFNTYEFAASAGRRIEIIAFLNNYYQSFEVSYLSFSDLQLSNTRQGAQQDKVISCAACDKSNDIKDFPYTQSYACVHCGARYVLQEGMHFKKLPDHKLVDVGPALQLGAKGNLNGVNYEVIGYTLKEEANKYRSRWKEYTLFNGQEGFVFLSEYNGHWLLVRERGDAPVLLDQGAKEFTYHEEPFQLFNAYRFEIMNASGCFPYNIFNDNNKDVKEFISPPEIWIQEKSPKEGIIWYLGTHIEGATLEQAFGDQITLPYKEGVGAAEPKGFINHFKLIIVSFVAAMLLIAIHALTSMSKQERVVLEKAFQFSDSSNIVSYVSPKINLGKAKSNLSFDIYAPVDNSWIELGATLVNIQTGAEYSLEKGVEYYYGYEAGESWSEGSKSATTYLDEIPRGEYFLQVQGIREQSTGFISGSAKEFDLKVTYDVPTHRNLLFGLIALLLWPISQYLMIQHNEKQRWYNSPFSPYEYEN